jgi:gliding motility-associated-like protein
MKGKFLLATLLGICTLSYFSCKKSSSSTPSTTTPSAFADSLKADCIHPFIGRGDTLSLYLPTAFTPNGDGVNDIYKIIGFTDSFSSFNLSIYDTTGALVWLSTSAARRWEGTDTATGRLSTKYKFYVKIKYTTEHGITDSGSTFVYLLSAGTGCVHAVAADSASYEFIDQFDPATGFNAAWGSYETYCP